MSAGIELRRLFPGITDGVKARQMARVIAGWRPVSDAPPSAERRHSRRARTVAG